MCYETLLSTLFPDSPGQRRDESLNDLPEISKITLVFSFVLFCEFLFGPALFSQKIHHKYGPLLLFVFYHMCSSWLKMDWGREYLWVSCKVEVPSEHEYEVDTAVGSLNTVGLKFIGRDSERRRIHSMSNSTLVVEVVPDPIPWPSLHSLKTSF